MQASMRGKPGLPSAVDIWVVAPLREQADESEIREFAWKGDTPDAAALTEEQLAANIRAAMEERKREAAIEPARRSS